VASAALTFASVVLLPPLYFGLFWTTEPRERGPAALLVAVLAMSLAPFFLVTDVVPGTVPVAVTLVVTGWRYRRRTRVTGAGRSTACDCRTARIPDTTVRHPGPEEVMNS
jgi:hypothetical protein